MIKRILLIIIAGILVFSFGCKAKRKPAAPASFPPPPPNAVVTDVKQEAAEQITEENMDSELDKIEKEITADINSQR